MPRCEKFAEIGQKGEFYFPWFVVCEFVGVDYKMNWGKILLLFGFYPVSTV